MKRVLFILFSFLSFKGLTQSIIPLKADSIIMSKSGGGYAEFVLRNRTKDTLGFLYNMGNGITEFRSISGVGGGWGVTGNTGITGSNFLGTLNAASLKFKVHNIPYGFLESEGSGNYNTALGYNSLNTYDETTPAFGQNTAYGAFTLESNIDGNFNNSFGYQSMRYNTTGSYNSAFGGGALNVNTTGSTNVAVGNALLQNTTGSNNTALGSLALFSNITGNYNIGLGRNSGSSFNVSNTLYISDSTYHMRYILDSAAGSAPSVIGKDGSGYWHVYANTGGGSGNTNSNIGSGYRLAIPGTNNIKTLFNGYAVGIDSSSNANGLTLKADSSLLQTKLLTNKLRDSLNSLITAKVNISDTATMLDPYYYRLGNIGDSIILIQHGNGVVDTILYRIGINIGEEVNAIVSTYTNYTTTATYQNVTSITLTAGDWDLSAFFTYSANSSTITAASNSIFVISTTTASASGATEGQNISYVPQAALLGTSKFSDAITPYRVSISGTTTYYLNTQATFTLGNPQYTGSIRARRMR